MDVFGDSLIKDPDPHWAKEELAALDKIKLATKGRKTNVPLFGK